MSERQFQCGDAVEVLYAERQSRLERIAKLSGADATAQIRDLAEQIEDINTALVKLAKFSGARHWPAEFVNE